ncbi:hypothetical protein TNCV_4932421 [Trichonephila clavipes]|nr:hypothetical protein TNCV_4932421 [Trichonephila clavipes]
MHRWTIIHVHHSPLTFHQLRRAGTGLDCSCMPYPFGLQKANYDKWLTGNGKQSFRTPSHSPVASCTAIHDPITY